MKIIVTIKFILLVFILKAQVIPPSQRVNWVQAGYQGQLPNPSLVVNVKEFGAKGDGVTNDHHAVFAAIASLNGVLGVVFFPEGTYLIQSTLNLPSNIILRGDASTRTTLKFNISNSSSNSITVSRNQVYSFVPVITGFDKGSSTISVSDVSTFAVGDYAEIRQQNGEWDIDPKSYATYCIGQVVKIKSISGKNLIFDQPLRIDYSSSLNPEVRKLDLIQNVGIEFLKIERDSDPSPSVGAGYNISFKYAANCWVKSVESGKSIGSHILADVSTHIQITGCYIHDAFTYDGTATRGYGVTLIQHSGEILIEDNIFSQLRHAMMVKQGANGNVFGYNYSINPYRSENFHDYGGDISLHGHYAFANLFEGNIVQNIHIDQAGGPSGPYNTFFRNRAERYGIWITAGSVNSDYQNFVGNEVVKVKFCRFNFLGTCYIYEGNYELTGVGHFEYANSLKQSSGEGLVVPAGTEDLSDVSYYKTNVTAMGVATASIGSPSNIGEGSNEAEKRYFNEPVKTYPDPYESLPVKFLDLKADIKDGSAIINWVTTRELNYNEFQIEKSTDGKSFVRIGNLPTASTGEEISNYSFIDVNTGTGLSYYRLRQVSGNWNFSYSDTVSVFKSSSALIHVSLFPNPVKELMYIKLEGVEYKEIGIKILSMQGKVLKQSKEVAKIGEKSAIEITLNSDFSSGLYTLVIEVRGRSYYSQFIKL